MSPFIIGSAFCFYLFGLLFIFPAFRSKAYALLQMPIPSTHSYLKALDSFRGLAALWVAAFHIWQWPAPAFDEVLRYAKFIKYGNKAVPIFVILSGFFIYRSLKKAIDLEDIRRYTIRRILRIFPLYFFTVIVAFIFVRFLIAEPFLQRFIAEIFMLRSLGYHSFITPAAWSLYIEMVFYFILPIFVIVTRKRPLFWVIFWLAIFVFADFGAPKDFLLWKYFLFGMLTCEMYNIYGSKINEFFSLLIFVFGLALLLIDFRYDWFNAYVAPSGSVPGFTVGLGIAMSLIIFSTITSKYLSRVFSLWPLHFLGVISYSVFMWHSFIIVAAFPITFDGKSAPLLLNTIPKIPALVMPLIILPALLFWSTVSFLLIERPFLERRP